MTLSMTQPERRAHSELAAMRLAVGSEWADQDDMEAQLALYSRSLAAKYPTTAISAACQRWAESNEWFPKLAQLHELCRDEAARLRPRLPPPPKPPERVADLDDTRLLATREGQDALRNEVAVPWLMTHRRGKPQTVAHLIPHRMAAGMEVAAMPDSSPMAAQLRSFWASRIDIESQLRAQHLRARAA